MTFWLGRGKREASLALSLVALAACGGQSADRGPGASGAGGAVQLAACTYNGVVYQSGERFGRCGECSCRDGGITCAALDCAAASGGSGVGDAGAGNAGGVGLGGSGASANVGAAGNSGASAASGAAGVSGSGAAGAGNACQLATIGTLCVLGT